MVGNNLPIPRCKETLSRDEFYRLKNIHDENPWLAYENVLGFYELWKLTENEEQKELLEFLIENFSYVDLGKLREACKLIANQVENVWQLSPENTIVTAICDNAKPDGSQFFLQAMKNEYSFEWRNSFYNAITNAVYEVKEHSNLVVIDDFIGTGNKVDRKITYVQNTLLSRGVADIRIYVCSLAAMGFSKERISKLANDLYSYLWLSKGIAELAPVEKKDAYNQEMLKLEQHLKMTERQRKLLSLGYEQSETLFSMASINVPNNVFPIFWWNFLDSGIERKPILRRL